MKVNKYETENLNEPYVDIYYQNYNHDIKQVEHFIENIDNTKIEVKDERGKEVINVNDVYYFEMIDRRCFACLKEKTGQTSLTLQEAENNFKALGFIRINKSIIVNVNHILKMKADFNMRILAELKNKELVQVNRSYKKGFQDFLAEYLYKEKL